MEGGVPEGFVAGALVGKPYLPRPEAACPLDVVAGRVDVVDAGMVLAAVGEQGQVLPHKAHRRVQGLQGLGGGERCDVKSFHGVPSKKRGGDMGRLKTPRAPAG